MDLLWAENGSLAGEIQLPESPRGPIEFLSRSWSASALQLSKALATPKPLSMLQKGSGKNAATIPETAAGEEDSDDSAKLSGHTFAFASSATSQLILERIMNQSAWPGRHLLEDGEQRRYFGLKTEDRGIVEFECKNAREYQMWTQGVLMLLAIVSEKKRRGHK